MSYNFAHEIKNFNYMTNKKNIGELIETEVRKQQIPITEFAKMICCQRNNVYDIFKRSKMDIAQLKQISKVLNRNFFKELAEDVELISDSKDSEEERNRMRNQILLEILTSLPFFYVMPLNIRLHLIPLD